MEPQTTTNSQTEIASVTGTSFAERFSSLSKNIATNYPVIVGKVDKAKVALSVFKNEIKDDAEDAAAEAALARTRATYELCNKLRASDTGILDELKSFYMEPEKEISNLKSAPDSQYNRVKSLRDAYAKKKHEAEQKKIREAEEERKRREEIARLNQVFETRFANNPLDILGQLRASVDKFINERTLETIDGAEAALNPKPNIKRETYESWLSVQTTLTGDDLVAFMASVRERYPYEAINTKYQEAAKPVIDEYKAKIPGKRKDLERLAELAKTNAEAAEAEKKRQDEQAAKELADKQQADADAKKANDEVAQRNADVAKLDANFNNAVTLQSLGTASKGTKITKAAVVKCEPKDVVRVMCEVMFACFQSPKFAGLFKLEKGTPNHVAPDADNVPIYTDWADTLLDFYANNSAQPIEGITLVDRVKTMVRSKKS